MPFIVMCVQGDAISALFRVATSRSPGIKLELELIFR